MTTRTVPVLLALLVLTAGCAGLPGLDGVDAGSALGDDGVPGDEPFPATPGTPMGNLSAAQVAALPAGIGVDQVDERAILTATLTGYANASFATTYSRKFYYGESLNRDERRTFRIDGERMLASQAGGQGRVPNRTYFVADSPAYTRDVRPDGSLQYGTVSPSAAPDAADALRADLLRGLLPYLDLRLTDIRTVDGETRYELRAFGVDPGADGGRSRLASEEHRDRLAVTVVVDEELRLRSLAYDEVFLAGPETTGRGVVHLVVDGVGDTVVAEPDWVSSPTTADGEPVDRLSLSASMVNGSYLALVVQSGTIPAGTFVVVDGSGMTLQRPLDTGETLYVYGTEYSINATRTLAAVPDTSDAPLSAPPRQITVVAPDMRPYWQRNTTAAGLFTNDSGTEPSVTTGRVAGDVVEPAATGR